MTDHLALTTFAIALAVGVGCQLVARHLRVPGVLLLLAAGFLCGPDGIGLIIPQALGDGLFGIAELGMAVILFEGGLSLPPSRLRRQEQPIRRLITVGALTTLVGATLAAGLILDWPWRAALMFGSLVIVTGPTVVTPLLRSVRLHPGVKTVLEAEGVLIDPVGAVAAALVLQIALAPPSASILTAFGVIVLHVGFGLVAGIMAGATLGFLLRQPELVPLNFRNILTLALLLLLFTVCEHLYPASGILAATVAGVVVGFMTVGEVRELREFKDQLTTLLVGLLFVLLSADVARNEVLALGVPGLLVVAVLIVVVRPLSVWLATRGTKLSWRERTFIAVIAPRGIVAAAIAALSAEVLVSAHVEGAEHLRGLVFLTIVGTVTFAGLAAIPAAIALGLRLPARNRVGILGADGLGLVLGDYLVSNGIPVMFIDANPSHVRQAAEHGHAVAFGDALDERVLARAQFDLVETAIAITANDHLNLLFVQHAHESFNVPRALVASQPQQSNAVPRNIRKYGVESLFESGHDVERWSVRLRHNDLATAQFSYTAMTAGGECAPAPATEGGDYHERSVLLALKRGRKVMVMTRGENLQSGDIGIFALSRSEQTAAIAGLVSAGWQPLAQETADVADAGEPVASETALDAFKSAGQPAG